MALSPLGRLDFIYLSPDHIIGFYLIDTALVGDWETWWGAALQLMLPAATMALFTLAYRADDARGDADGAVLGFHPHGEGCGPSNRKVLYAYAFRNALLPVVTTLGMVFSFALGANVLVEKVFAWPGIGSYAVEALVVSDYAAVQGFVLAMAMLFVALNLCIDLLYTAIDPRVAFLDQ